MRVLMAFSGDQQSFGVSELSDQLALPKSQVSKILATLRRHGLVTQDTASRRYSVGLRLLHWARAMWPMTS
jgi:DNA-binding IclR family transcriptional regulator